jgi:hypothetical protein
VEVNGAPVRVFLNRGYLAKALKFGLTQLELIDPLAPMLFREGGRRLVVMPVRCEGSDPGPIAATAPPSSGETAPGAEHAIEPAASSAPPASGAGGHASSGASLVALDLVTESIAALEKCFHDGLRLVEQLAAKLRLPEPPALPAEPERQEGTASGRCR